MKTSAAQRDPDSEAESSSRYLQLVDRVAIADGLAAGLTQTDIADKIGRHKSAVCREIAAHDVETCSAVSGRYGGRGGPVAARGVQAGHQPEARRVVEDGLRDRYSPEQISHRLVKDFPDDESMRVSHTKRSIRRCTSRPEEG